MGDGGRSEKEEGIVHCFQFFYNQKSSSFFIAFVVVWLNVSVRRVCVILLLFGVMIDSVVLCVCEKCVSCVSRVVVQAAS